jgi:hypothetical protein
MPVIEVDCNNRQEYNRLIDAIKEENPEFSDILFDHPNDEDIAEISEIIKTNKSLSSIQLVRSNFLGDGAAELIADAIKENSTLTDIALRATNITDDGGIKLAKSLKHNQTLTSFDLSYNRISDRTAVNFAESLKYNKTINTLDLSYTGIDDEGVIELANALKVNNSLIGLDLSYTNIGSNGAIKLAEAIEINKTLTNLCIYTGEKFNVDLNVHPVFIPRRNALTHSDIARVDALTERNKEFFYEAVNVFARGGILSRSQRQILKANLRSRNIDNFTDIPGEIKKNLTKQFTESMDDLKHRISDPSNITSTMLDNSKDILAFNKASLQEGNVGGRVAKSLAEKYFRGMVSEITPTIEVQFEGMIEASGELNNALKLNNNVVFIADAVNYGVAFSQITNHLKKILADPKAKEFAIANPKKLGYLMTLEEKKFKKAMGILNHKKLGEFVRINPQQIATLTRVSDDPEKLLRAVHAIKEDPNISSLKAVVNASESRYVQADKFAKKAEKRQH